MQIDLIDDFETFTQIKKKWDFVYEADPQAQFFLSWVWLSGWLKIMKEPWFILTAKTSTHAPDYVAFLPLKITINQQDGGNFYNEVYMAGSGSSDYTGFICLP